MIDRIQWLGHGSFIIQGSPLIYINPWRVVRSVKPADIILISHEHYDHCSLADIEKLRGPHTTVIANERAAREIEGCTILRAWQSMIVDRACIKGLPAYSPQRLAASADRRRAGLRHLHEPVRCLLCRRHPDHPGDGKFAS